MIVRVILFLGAHPRERLLKALGDPGAGVVFLAIHVQSVMLPEQLQRMDLVGELEFDAPDLVEHG